MSEGEGLLCPFCRTENSPDALRCSRCGLDFSVLDADATLGGGPEAPAREPSGTRPGTVTGVMTPPPANLSNFGAGFSSPTYGTGSVSLEPGTEFGARYRIEAKLGEGGMGVVYKAFDRDLDRRVALKLLRPEMVADATALARFKQELLLASKISHKNILRIHDLGDLHGLKFISMAFVEGEDLRGMMNREGRMPFEKIVTIAKQLCGALDAAQAEGVVHRDLKPQNVLVDKAGNIYVSDFGLAKSLEAGALGMTRTNEFLGTPRYMSPEQVQGGKIDHRSDLYSLGLILYEMVTGDVPFTGDSTLQVMFKRVKEPPKDPGELRADLPPYLRSIILKCLEKDAAQRYHSAKGIMHDLETQHAPSVSLRMPSFTLEGRNLLLAGVAAAVLLGGIAFAVVRGLTKTADTGAVADNANVRYVAVLPFNLAADTKNLSHLSEGLVDGLTGRLKQLSSVRVSSREAVQQVDPQETVQKIGRKLGASWLVRGSLGANAAGLRAIVSLENAQTGDRTWTKEFTGTASDPLGLEDRVYQGLLGALELNPSGDEVLRGTAHVTENLEAYDLYMRGRTALLKQHDAKSAEAAVRSFEGALAKDSRFALAYAGLADAYMRLYTSKKDAALADRALSAAQQAVRLDESQADAYFSLGGVYNAMGRTAEAISSIRQALQLAPNSDEGYRRLASSLYLSGRKDEAIQAVEKAIAINPYYWKNYNVLGDTHLQLGQFERALAAFKRVTEIEPDNATGYENTGVAYFLQGKYEACIPAFQKAIQLQPYFGTYSNLGTAFFYLKRYQEAIRMFEKAIEMNPNQHIAFGNLGDALRWAGQMDQSKIVYSKAVQLGLQDLRVNPRDIGVLGSLSLYYAKSGDPTRAGETIRRARAIDKTNPSLLYQEAVVRAIGKSMAESLSALREAIARGYPVQDAENDPELGELRATASFKTFLQTLQPEKKTPSN